MSSLMSAPFGHDPSATDVFAALPDLRESEKSGRVKRAVVIGGGTGAPMSLRTILSAGIETSAVVAMADDGGSTGILRDQAGATTPGDIRKCITAMAANPNDPLTQAFKVRFGFAENHTLGNLMLSALEVTSGGFPEAIRVCEQLLGARGHVYPSTLDRVTVVARTKDGRTLEGQAIANHSRTALVEVALNSDGAITAYQPAVEAIRGADLIVLGPGSLYTSIISCLIVPGVIQAIAESSATVVFVSSLADVQGETRGMSAYEHFKALEAHGMGGLVDCVLIHDARFDQADLESKGIRRVPCSREDIEAIEASGPRVLVRDLADKGHPAWHDPVKLRSAFMEVLR